MESYEMLEQEFMAWSHCYNPVVCSSGTAALHLALEALLLPKGSQVIVPEFTYIACARACKMAGLQPVFVDCGEDLLINSHQIEQSLTCLTSAIMPVHIYGRLCDMKTIYQIAQRYKLKIIEDRAECPIGSVEWYAQSDAVIWSFYRNKVVCGEEGGLVAFKNSSSASLAKQLRSNGHRDVPYYHTPFGNNYRLSNAHAKLIRQSLANVKENLRRRALIEAAYNVVVPIELQLPPRDMIWMYDIKLPPGVDNQSLVRQLNQLGIAARCAFKPMSAQPEFIGHYDHLQAWAMSQQVLYLPVSVEMSLDQPTQIVETMLQEAGIKC
jgi:dTDP-4-amino-4,6-dideoxygalactose transaminase